MTVSEAKKNSNRRWDEKNIKRISLCVKKDYAATIISIHAPRAGSDLPSLTAITTRGFNFNPRSPCGERQLTPSPGGRR